ncbi:ribbon-helix-helix protein, CopG family [Janthinobacterium sp. GB1R12]|uniref:ribbon-helix-helix protein, CopG family n=1 Tax=Janthinobacterium sp. GB1R12 TaxID=3424190 RepID=UPI003F236CB0
MKNLSKVGRITKGVTSQPLGVRLAPDEVKEIETLAADQQRSRAWFLRFLILRGLADYKREPAPKHTH